MGQTPTPTCNISLAAEPSFSNGTLTAKFNYTLSAMSGASRWGYGVVLQYGTSENLENSQTLVGTSARTWESKSGTITITKPNVSSSPQDFYFRLNSIASTGGAPGDTYKYIVTFATIPPQPEKGKISEITGISDFTVEYNHSFSFVQYDDSFRNDVWINVKNPDSSEDLSNWSTVLAQKDYHTNENLHFTPEAIATIYKIAMPKTAPGAYVDVMYHLETLKADGKTIVGDFHRTVKGFIQGNMFKNSDGTWKNCVPFVNVGGAWKPCVCYQNVNNSWKQTYC